MTEEIRTQAAAAQVPEPGRIAALDVLRLVAALWVLAWHWFYSGVYVHRYVDFATPALAGVSHYGFLGVQLFFVISGFVIAMSMQGRTVREFALARLIRLYPAYWMCAAITFAVAAICGDGRFPCDVHCAVANASMLNSFFNNDFIDPSYWTLGVELQFYFMLALLMAARGTRYLFEVMLLWMLLSAAGFVPMRGVDLLYYLSNAMWAPFFGCGAMLFLIWKRGPALRFVLGLVLGWLLACGYVARDVASFAGIPVPDPPFSPAMGIVLFSAFLVLVLLIALHHIRLRPSRFSRACGGTSYTLYLLHLVAGSTLINTFSRTLPHPLLMAAAFVLILLASALVWRFGELPVQRYLRRRLLPRSHVPQKSLA